MLVNQVGASLVGVQRGGLILVLGSDEDLGPDGSRILLRAKEGLQMPTDRVGKGAINRTNMVGDVQEPVVIVGDPPGVELLVPSAAGVFGLRDNR